MYKARDTRLDRLVAIKVLTAQFVDDPALRERFECEAPAWPRSAIHTSAPFTTWGRPLFSWSWSTSRARRSKRGLQRGPLPLGQALRHGIDIADALDKAHRAGIVHRDLKPGNVMLTKF